MFRPSPISRKTLFVLVFISSTGAYHSCIHRFSNQIVRIEFRNDGMPFRAEDWSRLKKIADGNNDLTKIGAFGVGFYSLFSICEEPLVESNGTWMGFHWKGGGDQLFARAGSLPSDSKPALSHFNQPWTVFTLDLRNPAPLESSVLELASFLTTSMTFMAYIRRAELYFDGLWLVNVSVSPYAPCIVLIQSVALGPLVWR